ncbi:MAG: FliG C-terminal domain-containing protein [bacterium]
MNCRFQTISILLILLGMLFVLSMSSAHAQTIDDAGYRISVENYLEEKLASVLTDITGTNKIIAIVQVDVRGTRDSGRSRGRGEITTQKKEDGLILPGVPIKKEFGKSQSEVSEAQFPEALSGRYMIQRINVTLLLGKDFSEEMMNTIRDVAMQVVGYNEARGDQLDIKRVDIKRKFFWSKYLLPPNLYWLILSVLGGLFLLSAALFMRDPFQKLSSALRSFDWGAIRGGSSSAPSAGPGGETRMIITTGVSEEKQGGDPGAVVAPRPFSFITASHIRDLAFLLKDEDSKTVAIVVNYLDDNLAMKLMEYFPAERQTQIALSLTGEAMDPERVHAVEEDIRGRLNYVIGGEEKLLSVLELAPEDVRDKIFDSLERKDPQTALFLRQKIKNFDTVIRELSEQGIQTLYRQVDHSQLALVLKSSPDDLREKVIASLTAGAAELLQQEIELSRPVSPERLKREKHAIMQVIRRMIVEGTLELEGN